MHLYINLCLITEQRSSTGRPPLMSFKNFVSKQAEDVAPDTFVAKYEGTLHGSVYIAYISMRPQ